MHRSIPFAVFAGLALAVYAATTQANISPSDYSPDDYIPPDDYPSFDTYAIPDFSSTPDAAQNTPSDVTGIAPIVFPGVSLPDDTGDDPHPPVDNMEGDDMAYWKTNQYPVYASTIRETELAYGIPVDLLARTLYQESRFSMDVITGAKRSKVGAIGIAQFMPAAASDMGLMGPGFDHRTNPYLSIDAAGRYLAQLYRMFGRWKVALMAYNWGAGNVQKWLAGGRTMPAETADYIAKIGADIPAVA